MRNSLRRPNTTSSWSALARTGSGLQHPQRGFTSAKVLASLLLTMSLLAAHRASADEQMVLQRPGMKSEQDYQRFVQERGLPQRSEPTQKELDRLRSQAQKELRLEEEYARRNASNLSKMSDEDILNAIRLKTEGNGEPPSVDAREDWPKTPEEFEKKYGRPPQRREEVEFYFDPDDDIDPDEEGAS